jgi:hypothetical protein
MIASRLMRASLLVGIATATATATLTTPGWADDAACIQSYEQTQTLRREGKLRDARDAATKCARDTCPAILAKDCTTWMSELESSIPTLVFDVRGPAGEEVTQVKVLLDGQPLVERIEGKSVPVDVGSHVFRFEPADGKGSPVEQRIVVHEGDRNRKISVTLGGGTPGAVGSRAIPLPALVFGGVGVVALGVGTVFAISGSSKESDLDACKPSCPADDVNSVSSSYAVADILLSAGVVSLAAAAVFFLTRPGASTAAATNAQYLRFRF